MNKVILMGRLTRDPEVRYSQGATATAIARFSIAVDRRFKRDGEPDADFINCVARCQYCHNVDTWNPDTDNLMTADELLDKAERFRSYWGKEGGITVSGGEALLQIDFLIDLFRKSKISIFSYIGITVIDLCVLIRFSIEKSGRKLTVGTV